MKFFRSIIALTSVFALCASAVPPAQAATHYGSIRNSSPRGFKRSISRARDVLKTKCIHEENANERRACMKEYRNSIRENATPITANYIQHNNATRGERCGFLSNTSDRRACMRNARAAIPQGSQRTLNKRTRTRTVKAQREECREKSTSAERLKCLRSFGNKRRSKITQLIRRNIPTANTSVNNIAPQGLRRNLSRSRDLVKEACGEILDGNEKRACIKRLQKKYRGF
jgi:hypothetical protein